MNEERERVQEVACLRPVGGVPARSTGRSLALPLRVRLVVQQAVVVADDGHDGAELLHAHHVARDHSVAARHRALRATSTASPSAAFVA